MKYSSSVSPPGRSPALSRCGAAVLLLASFLWQACATSPVELSVDEFMHEARRFGTMESSEYLGIEDGYALVCVREMSSSSARRWSKEFYKTPAKRLSVAQRAELKAIANRCQDSKVVTQ